MMMFCFLKAVLPDQKLVNLSFKNCLASLANFTSWSYLRDCILTCANFFLGKTDVGKSQVQVICGGRGRMQKKSEKLIFFP